MSSNNDTAGLPLQLEHCLSKSVAINRRVRVAVVDSHPIQYHYQYFKLLAANPEIDLTVFYSWDTREGVDDPNYGKVKWDVPVLDGYSYRFLRNWSPRPGPGDRLFSQINPGLISELVPSKFDVVWVWGYSNLTALIAVITARVRRLRILFRGESTLDSPRSGVKKFIKAAVLKKLLRLMDCVAYSCAANRKYYEHYGVPPKRLIFAACAVDNQYFQGKSREGDRRKNRLTLGLTAGRPALLFVGRLEDRKRPLDIVKALELFPKQERPVLLLVGDGPLRGHLESYCNEHSIQDVHFLGFRNQSELALFYGAADALLVVSESDPSPKVLNEAMNFGLPAIVSDRVGTAGDLIVDGWNGFVVPCGDIVAIAKACERICYEPSLAMQMRQNALRKIDDWSFEKGAAAISAWLLRDEK